MTYLALAYIQSTVLYFQKSRLTWSHFRAAEISVDSPVYDRKSENAKPAQAVRNLRRVTAASTNSLLSKFEGKCIATLSIEFLVDRYHQT